MAIQYSVTHQTNNVADISTLAGATAYLLIYSGTAPAHCSTAASGTLLASLPCSATVGTSASGVLTFNAITSAAAVQGTAGYWRLCTSSAGTTVIAQGTVFQTTSLTTNAATAANGNVLTFAATTGAEVGMTVSGTGVPSNTTVAAVSGTTITMSQTSTAGVANSAAITLGGDVSFPSTAFSNGETIGISSFTITANGA